MFLVKNITKKEVSLADLRVELAPGDQIDLDMVCSRFHTEQSRSLKNAFAARSLFVVLKDDHRGDVQIQPQEKFEYPTANASDNKKNEDILGAVKDIEAKLLRKMEEKLDSQKQPSIDTTALNQAIAALQSIAALSGKSVLPVEDQSESNNEKVVNIHERTLNRLTSKTEGKVKNDQQSTDNSTVKRNIDELEGLL